MTEPRKPDGTEYVPGYETNVRHANRELLVTTLTPPRAEAPVTFVECTNACLAGLKCGNVETPALLLYRHDKGMGLMFTFEPEGARALARQLVQAANDYEAAATAEADRKLADIGFASKPGVDRPGFNPQAPKGGAA